MSSLIEELKGEAAWDSSGRFQVDLLRRSEKIFKLQVNQPHLHLLKFLQAGVADGVREIALNWSADSIRLEFQPQQLRCQSVHRFLNFGEAEGRSTQHLGNAVMLASVAAGRGFRVRFWDGQDYLEITPAGLSLHPSPEPPAFQLEFTRPSQRWWNWSARRAADSHLQQSLSQRFQFSPVSIRGNGRLLNRGNLSVVAWFPHRKSVRKSLLEIVLPDYEWLIHSLVFGPGLAFQPPYNRYQTLMPARKSLWGSPGRTAILECEGNLEVKQFEVGADYKDPWLSAGLGGGENAELYLLKDAAVHTLPDLATEKSAQGRLQPPLSIQRLTALSILPAEVCLLAGVQDGMLLDPVPIPGPPGGLVLTAAPHWQTDLGQLVPVKNEHWKSEETLALLYLKETLARVRDWAASKDLVPRNRLPKQVQSEWSKI